MAARGWNMTQTVGMSIPNPRGMTRVTGDPEQLQEFVDAVVCECGETRKLNEEGDTLTCEGCGLKVEVPHGRA